MHNWVLLPVSILLMVILSLTLTSFGAGIASMVEDFQGFQSINNFIIFPMFFLSSALYPLTNAPDWLRFLASINPISYFVDALRYTMSGQTHFGITKDIIVITISLLAAIFFAANRFDRIQV
jgi:ABC-2 type transport system permease protein